MSQHSPSHKLDNDVTCPVCYGTYNDPRILPCQHSFCHQCIQGLKKDGMIKCPACYKILQAPRGGFPKDLFAASKIKEIHNKQRERSAQEENCIKHKKPFELFCEDCQELACPSCKDRSHKSHNWQAVVDALPEHKSRIESLLQERVTNKITGVISIVWAIEEREDNIASQSKNVKQEIFDAYRRIREIIRRAEKDLIEEVDNIESEKLQLLDKQKKLANTALGELVKCESEIKKSLEASSPQHILCKKGEMIEKMKSASKQVEPSIFQPVEEANIKFTPIDISSNDYKKAGAVKHSISLVTGSLSLESAALPLVGSRVTATLRFQTKFGCPYWIPESASLTCHLIFPKAAPCDVEEVEKGGCYNISFISSMRGPHQLRIQVEGADINGGPFLVHVAPLPEKRGEGEIETISELKAPSGIAVNKSGQLLVAEHVNHCITLCSNKGEKIQSFGTRGILKGQLSNPSRVAVTDDGHILVSDYHRLQKLAPDGTHVMSVGNGKPGSGPLQFSTPVGIAVHPTTGQIYVADRDNHRIQVLNDDFTHSFNITNTMLGRPRLVSPCDVAVDGEGRIYVVNYGESCIRIFNRDGKYVCKFGSKGYDKRRSSTGMVDIPPSPKRGFESANPRLSHTDSDVFPSSPTKKMSPRRTSTEAETSPTSPLHKKMSPRRASEADVFHFQPLRSESDTIQLQSPTSVAIDANNYVYVTEEGNNSVSIFTIEGDFIQRISHVGPRKEELNCPHGIAVDKIGNLYISDTGNNRIIVL